MGQKTHPYGFRLGIIKPWRSRYFARHDFPELLKEDDLIRKYLKTRLSHAAIADIHIERKPGKVTVTVHTGRPGVVIGKRGAEADKLRDEPAQLTAKEVGINVEEIKRPERDAQLVADSVADQLTPRTPVRPAMKRPDAMLARRRVKFRKRFKGRTKGMATRGNTVAFGHYGLMALEPGWISNRQIEASRVALTREMKRGGKVWIRLFPDKPITKKPAETRMGKGKGNPEGWVAVVKPGRVMFELEGIAENLARKALALAAAKLPIKSKFVKREER